ncbi:MAG: hypothetical protein HYX26_05290 [Acidobacteriales bacterium]|nr:hypothetical protein [Terriglobales bacterium]
MSNKLCMMMNNKLCMMRMEDKMPSAQVAGLTRQDIIKTARNFKWSRKMPKWTTVVENVELPARPLVLSAASVPPNDPTNSHQAIAKLKELGFVARYEGKPV